MNSKRFEGRGWLAQGVFGMALALGFGLSGCGDEPARVGAQVRAGAERVPGTLVHIVKPEGFSAASNFAGFQDVNTNCSVVVLEMAAPFDDLAEGFADRAAMKTKGMLVTDRIPMDQGTYPGLLCQVDQKTMGTEIRKWVWLFGGEEKSVMVMGICPKALVDTQFDRLGDAVLSAAWEPNLILDPASEFGFHLEDTGGLVPMGGMTKVLSYNSDGKVDQGGDEGKPLFIAAPSNQATPSTPEKYSKQRLRLTAGHKEVKPAELVEISIDGLTGFECLATSVHRNTGEPSLIYQVMLFEGSSYWVLTGIARERDREQYLPVFQRMAMSFRREFETVESDDGKTTVELPRSWTMRAGLSDDAELQAGNPVADMYLIVLSEAQTTVDEDIVFEEFAFETREAFAQGARYRGEVTTPQVNGMDTSQVLMGLHDDNLQTAYLHAAVRGKDHYHQVILWCVEKDKAYAMPAFQKILSSFREVK